MDGHDFFATYEVAGRAIQAIRAGEGPRLLHLRVNRYYGHFEGDAARYRPKDEVERVREERDCLQLFRRKAVDQRLLSSAALDEIDRQVQTQIEAAVAHARAAPPPEAADLHTDVYAAY